MDAENFSDMYLQPRIYHNFMQFPGNPTRRDASCDVYNVEI